MTQAASSSAHSAKHRFTGQRLISGGHISGDTKRKTVYGFEKHKSPVFACRRALEKLQPTQQAALAQLFGFEKETGAANGKSMETIEYKRAHLLIKKISPNLRKPLFGPLGYRAKRAAKPAVKPELMATVVSTTAATEAAPEILSRPGSRCSSKSGNNNNNKLTARLSQGLRQHATPGNQWQQGNQWQPPPPTSRSFLTTSMEHLGKRSSYVPTYIPVSFPYTSTDQVEATPGLWGSNNLAEPGCPPAPTPRSYNPSDLTYAESPRPAPIAYDGWAPQQGARQASRPCSRYATVARRALGRVPCGSFYTRTNGVGSLDPNVRGPMDTNRPQTR